MKNKDTVIFHNCTIHISEISNMSYPEQCELLHIKGNAIQYLQNPTTEQQIIAVRQNGYAIRHIKNPSYEVQETAFLTSPTSVQFVDEPYKDLVEKAFEKDPNVLPFIKSPTYAQKKNAVSRKGATIQYIKNPTAELIDIAIAQNPRAVGHIDNPNNEVLLRAIRHNPSSVKNIINKIPRRMQIMALELKGFLIKYISNPDSELIDIALKSDPSAIKYVKNPSIEQQVNVISRNPELIDFVDTSNQSIQEASISKKPNNIYKVNTPTNKTLAKYNSIVIKKEKKAKHELAENGVYPLDHYYVISKYTHIIKENLSLNGYCEFVNQFDESLTDIIKAISSFLKIKNVCIATGYLFKSGINELKQIILPIIEKSGKIELVVGSLQKYISSNEIDSMDYETATYLNGLLNLKYISLATFCDSFYHGKFYKFTGEKYTCIIIGSSNVSKSGLCNNIELNSIFIYSNSDRRLEKYDEWFNRFIKHCNSIDMIDTSRFINTSKETDTLSSNDIGTFVSKSTFEKKTYTITDKEIRERMQIWLSHHPSKIVDNISISPFDNYVLFVYGEKNLFVFESFTPGNAFYCFKTDSIDNLIKIVSGKTKVQLYKTSEFYKRGYHINDSLSMKINIASLF